MVHNGIEYGDMQLICEAYQLLKEGLGLSNEEMHDVFAEWNKGELDSYLIEITRDILGDKDENGELRGRQDPRHRRAEGHRQVDQRQLARPGHAGHADRRGGLRPLPVRDEGRARGGRRRSSTGRRSSSTATARRSSRTSGRRCWPRRSSRYAQGFMLLREAAKEYNWNLNYGGIALVWRGGCIIRSRVPRQDQGGLRHESRPQQPAARSRTSRA